MKLIDFIVGNASSIVALLCLATLCVLHIVRFVSKSRDKQIMAMREWLLYAVTLAEKELGHGTGKLKLRSVYDMFIVKFPWLAKIISFNEFSNYVDDALIQMKQMLSTNTNIVSFVDPAQEV